MLRKFKKYCFNLLHPVIGEVWQLHRVTPNHSIQKKHRPYEIVPERLETLIIEYKNKGYEFIAIRDVVTRLQSKNHHKRKFIAITLDDGYADNFEYAYPIFKKYNIPFCIFLCENMIKGMKREDDIEIYSFLTLEQINMLNKDRLCTLGSHTTSHVRLSKLSVEQQYEEIQHCIDWLENVVNKRVDFFAYPYGDYNSDTIDILRRMNINGAFAAWGGGIRSTCDMFIIPRVLM